MVSNLDQALITPIDAYNQKLVAQVHPSDWVNPLPADRYDLVVIGAGTAGLVTAAGAAGLGIGLKVALIERHLMGGDCLNVGCVPSKCLIRSGRAAAAVRQAQQFGVTLSEPVEVDFAAVMQRMRRLRADISHNDSAQRFRQLGVDVFLGEARLIRKDAIVVADTVLRFKKAVIATGARAAQPAIAGLAEAGFLTNETVFSLTERPGRMAVIGGGPIGCEMAQTFQQLGCEVTLIHRNGHLLDREDADAATLVQEALIRDGVQVELNCTVERVETSPGGKTLYLTNTSGSPRSITVDEILVGAGRSPNVEGLGLEVAGVAFNRQGIQINDYLQTTNLRIFAAGDVCMNWKFTHAADAAARLVIKNALFAPFGLGRSRLSHLVMPWTTYTSPEIAHVGLYEQEAQKQGISVKTILIPLSQVDRAITDGEEQGFVKIHYRQGSDQIVGATVVANHAGDLISEITTAMVGKVGLSQLAGVIHPYPTQAEAIKKAADAYRRSLLTERTKRLLGLLNKLA